VIRSALLRSSPGRTFESLYKRHVKDVYRYSLAMLPRQTDAEDATQTTFMNAYRALERGERPRDAAKWLRAIALNVCREHYRRASRRPSEVALEEDFGELVLDPPTPAISDVVRGLACLPFNQRAALVMREFEGRSLTEIATCLEISGSAVETLLFRARRSLREQLEERLSCNDAEQAISRQLDGALPRSERGPLRAHLRACPDCASLARRLRAQRSAVRSLALLPLPASLRLGKLASGSAASASAGAVAGQSLIPAGGSLFTALSGSLAAKIAVVAVGGATAFGAGYASLDGGRAHGSAQAGGTHALGGNRGLSALVAAEPPGTSRRAVAQSRGAALPATAASPTKAASAAKGARAVQSARPRHAHSSPTRGSGRPGSPAVAGPQPRTAPPAVTGAGHGRPSQQGVAHGHQTRSRTGHAYGHTKTKVAKPGPRGHAYGRAKAKGTKPAPAAKHQPQAPATAPGQLKKQGAVTGSHGK
jgi:RNA polymerase sigma factor (sigma-70 family)